MKRKKRERVTLGDKKISAVLKELPAQFTGETMRMDEMSDILSGRSYGIFLLVLAIPNLIPVPAPGLSAILGAPLILFTFQLMLGLKTPWFPPFIARRKVKRSHMKRICDRAVPYLERLERFNRPRLSILIDPPADRIIALICVALSLIIMMPVPFGNALPALAICLFALGILQRDGLFVILGATIGTIAAAIIFAFFDGILTSVGDIFGV